MSSHEIENHVVDAIHTIHYSTGSGLPISMYDGIVRAVLVEKGFKLVEAGEIFGKKLYEINQTLAMLLMSEANEPEGVEEALSEHIKENGLKLGLVVNFGAPNPTEGTRRVESTTL